MNRSTFVEPTCGTSRRQSPEASPGAPALPTVVSAGALNDKGSAAARREATMLALLSTLFRATPSTLPHRTGIVVFRVWRGCEASCLTTKRHPTEWRRNVDWTVADPHRIRIEVDERLWKSRWPMVGRGACRRNGSTLTHRDRSAEGSALVRHICPRGLRLSFWSGWARRGADGGGQRTLGSTTDQRGGNRNDVRIAVRRE